MLLPGGLQPPYSGTSTPHAHPSSSTFVRAFSAAQELISVRVRMGKVWPAPEVFKDKSEEYTHQLRAYLQPIVDAALQRREYIIKERQGRKGGLDSEKGAIEEGMTLLDHLVLQTDDVDIIRDSLLNMLIAGRDTVSISINHLGACAKLIFILTLQMGTPVDGITSHIRYLCALTAPGRAPKSSRRDTPRHWTVRYTYVRQYT